MAKEIKKNNRDSLIVFGGKHQDETLYYLPGKKKIKMTACNTINLIYNKKIPPLVDMVISGQGESPLRFINEKLGDYLKKKEKFYIEEFKKSFLLDKKDFELLEGEAILGLINKNKINLIHTRGNPFPVSKFGSPYQFFPIRTRNNIFLKKDGTPKLSTNLITTRGCKNRCIYCSESILLNKYVHQEYDIVDNTLERVLEDIRLGTESIFFDDSIFFMGNLEKILNFSNKLLEKKILAKKELNKKNSNLKEIKESQKSFLYRLKDFEYAVQFCIEDIVREPDKKYVLKTLKRLKKSGCSYIYTGIESLDDKVMKNVQKFKRNENEIYSNWFEKVNSALEMFKQAKINVGASLLFGIPGETYKTIDNTINLTKKLIQEKKLYLVSPNLCSYHPRTELTRRDKMIEKLDYIKIPKRKDSTLSFFEEASEKHLSRVLNKEMILHIKKRLKELENLNSNTIEKTINEKKKR